MTTPKSAVLFILLEMKLLLLKLCLKCHVAKKDAENVHPQRSSSEVLFATKEMLMLVMKEMVPIHVKEQEHKVRMMCKSFFFSLSILSCSLHLCRPIN